MSEHTMTCPTCVGRGSVKFTAPPGVRVSFFLPEIQMMPFVGPCQTTSARRWDVGRERARRFQPRRSNWPLLPTGLEYAHLCHEPRCGNPDHFVVTTKEINKEMDKGMFKDPNSGTATHCKRGHPREGNTGRNTLANGSSFEFCLPCRKESRA